MNNHCVVSLDASSWDLFAELVERNNGIFGGCWCIGYHPECGQKGIDHRTVKEERVRSGRAHHAMVVDADGFAQGWCQWGDPDELSNIKHRRKYDQDPPPRPDWRITCIFVDKKHRLQGVARMGGSCSAGPSSSWRSSASSGCGSWASTRGSSPSGSRRRWGEPNKEERHGILAAPLSTSGC